LQHACPKTCGLCTDTKLTPKIDQFTCEDNDEFLDVQGANCAEWAKEDCSTTASFGLSKEEGEAVLINCPRSCHTCEPDKGGGGDEVDPSQDQRGEEARRIGFGHDFAAPLALEHMTISLKPAYV
jgi:hypothetical protein